MTSNITSIVQSAPARNWLSCHDYFQKLSNTKNLSKNDIKFISKELESALRNKKSVKACNWLTLGLIFNPETFVERLREKGILRPSKYDFDISLLPKIISKIETKISLPTEVKEYLSFSKNISIAACDVFSMQQDIILELRRGKGSIFRYLLIFADTVFLMQTKSLLPLKMEGEVNDLSHFQAEDIAEAVGYILYIYSTKIGSADHPNPKYSFSNFNIENMVLAAAKIRSFCEFEIYVDYYGYSLTVDPENSRLFSLTPSSESLEKAHRYGYIQTDQQAFINLLERNQEEGEKLEDIGAKIYDDFGKELITRVETPIDRYVMAMPLPTKIRDTLFQDALFSEERHEVTTLSKEWSVTPNDLLSFRLSDHVTMMDVLKVHRFFNLLRWIFISHLFPLWNSERETVMESLVGSISSKELKQVLDLVLGKNSEPIISFLCYTPEKQGVFDLQYQPIVKKDQYYSIPYNLLGNSNILRNSLQLSRRRFYEDGQNDPLSQLLYKVVSTRTQKAKENHVYQDGELDVIALIDGMFFVFECKNSTLPCNAFEARTSYDYIKKAASQLERFKKAYASEKFRKSLGNSLGWDISSAQLVTCIVMSNRMFLGHRINGHAVRGSREIVNQIHSGIVRMNDEEKCLWLDGDFTGEDLRRYIEEDTLIEPVWKAMLPTERTYPLKKYSIKQQSFALDMELLAQNWGFDKTAEQIANMKKSISEDYEA